MTKWTKERHAHAKALVASEHPDAWSVREVLAWDSETIRDMLAHIDKLEAERDNYRQHAEALATERLALVDQLEADNARLRERQRIMDEYLDDIGPPVGFCDSCTRLLVKRLENVTEKLR